MGFFSELRITRRCDSSEEVTSQEPSSSVPHVVNSNQNRSEISAGEASNPNLEPSNPDNYEKDPLEASTSSIQQQVDEDTDFDDFGDFAGVDAEDSKTGEVGERCRINLQFNGHFVSYKYPLCIGVIAIASLLDHVIWIS